MNKMKYISDRIILTPDDIDLSYSPLRNGIKEETYVLGAFNPGLERLGNGNIIIMVRIAEAIKNPIRDGKICCIRWCMENKFKLDWFNLDEVITDDPRKFLLKHRNGTKVYGLTSLSWILPIELNHNGSEIIKIHYDKIISPTRSHQEFGIEDARITKIENNYYLTTCSVSSERHSTTLYSSSDGIDYKYEAIIFDHQNKDVLLFPEKIGQYFYALTRPLGDHYFVEDKGSQEISGPSINLSQSPDLIHWKPTEKSFIRMKKDKKFSMKVGGGAQPIKTEDGWLILYHAVEADNGVGKYKTFCLKTDLRDPHKIIKEYENEILAENKILTKNVENLKYVNDVVFTTGIIDHNDCYLIASGESDLCCRLTTIEKKYFNT